MAINAYGDNIATNGAIAAPSVPAVDKTALGKDDFMTLLLVELQHQDPTEPMDSEKILTQTSQLAGLESAENTNKALESLAASLSSSQQFSTVAAIGKTADLGSNAIGHDEGKTSSFEMYFPESIEDGNIEILDNNGNVMSTIPLEESPSGVYQYDWDGKLSNGEPAPSAMYYITASYNDQAGKAQTTRMGRYPIESVRFDGANTMVKVGSSYVPLENVTEIY